MPRSREAQSRSAAKAAPAALTTREQLIDLAAEVFAAEGYAAASVRDLGRRLGVTSGALYGNFRGKADLLAEAVDTRLTTDLWDLPEEVTQQSLVEMVAYQFAHYKSREQLMSLLLEGALAARGDAEVKERLHDTLGERLSASTKAFRSRRDAEGFDPAVNLDAVVKIIWSMEIGLRALSALGFQTPSQKDAADVVGHFMRGLQASSPPPRPSKATKSSPRKSAAKKAPAPRKASRKSNA
jgi:AcrR family transcriptional regulator